MKKLKFDLVVTPHYGVFDFLKEKGFIKKSTRVLQHTSAEDVAGLKVCGVLPHYLSCLCKVFAEIPLSLTPAQRKKELSVEEVRVANKKAGGKLNVYTHSKDHLGQANLMIAHI